MGKFTETEKVKGYQRLRKGVMGSFCLMVIVFVWGYEKALEIDNGNVCTTLWISLMPLDVYT